MTEFEAKMLSELSEIKTDIKYLKEKDKTTDERLNGFKKEHITPLRNCVFGNGKKGLTEKVRFVEFKIVLICMGVLAFKDYVIDRIVGH